MEQDTNKLNSSTSNSKKTINFLAKLLLALGLFVWYIFFHIMPEYKYGYNAALNDKVNRLKSLEGPKIVLLGNSNVAFGINSQLIEEAFGMPVVNMGLHGSLGNKFHENMAYYNVEAGDIYVICHSDFNDDNMIRDAVIAWNAIENNLELWKILRAEDIKTMAEGFPVYLKKSLSLYSSGEGNAEPKGIYSRNSFNDYGDVAVLRKGNNYKFNKKVSVPEIGDVTVKRINELNQYLTSKGAKLVVAAYPIGNGSYTVAPDKFLKFQNNLGDQLDCDVISNYVDYMYDYKYFYNTAFHLNSEGADFRTNQLIYDLQRWMENNTEADFNNDQYEDIIFDMTLSHLTEISEYLDALNQAKKRYTIFISAKDDASLSMNDEISQKLNVLGLKASLNTGYSYGYIAVIEKGNVIEEQYMHEKLEAQGRIDDGKVEYKITSGGFDRGSISSVQLNDAEFSRDKTGLNFVIYSNELHRVIDEVTYDTNSAEIPAIRK